MIDDEMCVTDESVGNVLCFAGLVHDEEITERWIQRISRNGYKD